MWCARYVRDVIGGEEYDSSVFLSRVLVDLLYLNISVKSTPILKNF